MKLIKKEKINVDDKILNRKVHFYMYYVMIFGKEMKFCSNMTNSDTLIKDWREIVFKTLSTKNP